MGERPALNSPSTQSRSRLYAHISNYVQQPKLVNILFFVTVNGERRPAILTQIFGDIVRNPLCTNKNQDFSILLANLVKMFDQLVAFFEVTADFDDLRDVVIGRKLHGTNVNLNEILQEILHTTD